MSHSSPCLNTTQPRVNWILPSREIILFLADLLRTIVLWRPEYTQCVPLRKEGHPAQVKRTPFSSRWPLFHWILCLFSRLSDDLTHSSWLVCVRVCWCASCQNLWLCFPHATLQIECNETDASRLWHFRQPHLKSKESVDYQDQMASMSGLLFLLQAIWKILNKESKNIQV